MCGSGTLNVEAALIGVNSIGLDKNPFASFMSKVKLESLSLDSELLNEMSKNLKEISKNGDTTQLRITLVYPQCAYHPELVLYLPSYPTDF